jgi:hypothetical protein
VTGFLVAGTVCALGGCDSSSKTVAPNLGTIEVTTLTEGPGLLPDSFTVLLDMAPSGSVAANGIYTIPFLPRGDYRVALREDSENCFYGVNARTVTVEPDETTPTTFLVRCQ